MWSTKLILCAKFSCQTSDIPKRWKDAASFYYYWPTVIVPQSAALAYTLSVATILPLTTTHFCQIYSVNGAKTKLPIRLPCSTRFAPSAVPSTWTCFYVRYFRQPVSTTILRVFCPFWCLFPHANHYVTRSVLVTLLSNRKIGILARKNDDTFITL